MKKETKKTLKAMFWALALGMFITSLGVCGLSSIIYGVFVGDWIDYLLATFLFGGCIALLKHFDAILEALNA